MRVIIGFVSVAIRLADVFERPTLRGCQCGGALGRVKPLRTLTLPCQKTNPDGVICGCVVAEIGWQDERLGVSVCRVGVLWDYLRMCGCENWLAGLAFRSKR